MNLYTEFKLPHYVLSLRYRSPYPEYKDHTILHKMCYISSSYSVPRPRYRPPTPNRKLLLHVKT